MMVAVGIGAWDAAMFHLTTHAFFQMSSLSWCRSGNPRDDTSQRTNQRYL